MPSAVASPEQGVECGVFVYTPAEAVSGKALSPGARLAGVRLEQVFRQIGVSRRGRGGVPHPLGRKAQVPAEHDVSTMRPDALC